MKSTHNYWILEFHLALPLYALSTPICFNTSFVSSQMYPDNPEGTRVIVGSIIMNMRCDIYSTCQESNSQPVPFQLPKCAPIPLGHSDGYTLSTAGYLYVQYIRGDVGCCKSKYIGYHLQETKRNIISETDFLYLHIKRQ